MSCLATQQLDSGSLLLDGPGVFIHAAVGSARQIVAIGDPSGQAGPYYPERARRLGEGGIVMLKFNVGGDGTARGVTVAGDANADLAKTAVLMVRRGRFKVPQAWEQSAGPKQSFTMEFRFELSCPAAHPPPELVPEPQVMTLCGSTIPH